MKIMFLIGKVSNIGGIPRVVSLVSDSLIKNTNYEIHIVSYLNEQHDGYDWNKNIKFHGLLKNSSSMRRGIFKASKVLRKILLKENINVLVSCGSLFGPLGVIGTRFTRTKLIYWDHSNYFENSSHKFKITSKKFTAYFADIVIPLTKADEMNYQNNTYSKNIIQIYNPVDPKLENLVHDYDITSKKIISVGRLTNQKNFLCLIDVARLVFDKYPNYEWHIFGSGPEYELIKTKISKYNLTENVLLKGQSDILYSLYKSYSMMVMTSRYEGFPMSLLEGMANKLPLISFDIQTGPNEIITDSLNGYLIPEYDIKEMANKIINLIENDQLRIDFSFVNSKSIVNFNMNSITKKWIDLIEQLTYNDQKNK